jgi:hypothetical protein
MDIPSYKLYNEPDIVNSGHCKAESVEMAGTTS